MRLPIELATTTTIICVALMAACAIDPDEDREELAVFAQPPSQHELPSQHPSPWDYEYPTDAIKCLNCHRPADPNRPPLPPECTRCHVQTVPGDPHGGMYPPRPDPPLPIPPGDVPVPDFCLDCHYVDGPVARDIAWDVE